MSAEPTNQEVLAAMIGLAIYTRRIIDATDQGNPKQVASTLASIHENLGILGGSAAQLVDDLGIKQEVEGLVSTNLAREQAYTACAGLEGRA